MAAGPAPYHAQVTDPFASPKDPGGRKDPMTPSRALLTVALVALVALPSAVRAATLAIYFDTRANDSTREAQAFETIQWYVLALDIADEVKGYEFTVRVPSSLAVTSRVAHPATAINVGAGDNWIVGAGTCVAGAPLLLASYQGMLISNADNVILTLEAASPSSVPGNVPAYLTCDGDLREFDRLQPGGINTEAGSWGRLKNRY